MRPDRALRYAIEVRAHLGKHGVLVDVARDHEDGVVRGVPAIVETLEVGTGEAVERRDRPDALTGVRRARERERLHVAKEVVARRRVVAQHLLLDRAALVLPLRLRIEDVAHAVRFDRRTASRFDGRNAELELRQRVGGLRVERTPERRRDRTELARAEVGVPRNIMCS